MQILQVILSLSPFVALIVVCQWISSPKRRAADVRERWLYFVIALGFFTVVGSLLGPLTGYGGIMVPGLVWGLILMTIGALVLAVRSGLRGTPG
jgi:hypothetical protein